MTVERASSSRRANVSPGRCGFCRGAASSTLFDREQAPTHHAARFAALHSLSVPAHADAAWFIGEKHRDFIPIKHNSPLNSCEPTGTLIFFGRERSSTTWSKPRIQPPGCRVQVGYTSSSSSSFSFSSSPVSSSSFYSSISPTPSRGADRYNFVSLGSFRALLVSLDFSSPSFSLFLHRDPHLIPSLLFFTILYFVFSLRIICIAKRLSHIVVL